MAKATKKAPAAASGKARTKSEIFKTLADITGLNKKDVVAVLEGVGQLIKQDISPKGPGVFNFMGLMKIAVRKRPPQKAREGTNPATGEKIMIAAKPATKVIRVRPLKTLKEMI